MVFIFQFVNVVYYIDWFADIEESLHPWDKAHLIMVYDLFNVYTHGYLEQWRAEGRAQFLPNSVSFIT